METAQGQSETLRADDCREWRRYLAEHPAYALAPDAMWGFVRGQRFSGRDHDVLWACLGHMEAGNILRHSAMSLAHLYAIPYGSFLRSWNKLIALNVLVPTYNDVGQLRWYYVAPRLAYRGRPWHAEKMQQQLDAQGVLDALEEEMGAYG